MQKQKNGFTFIEVLIAMALIAMLASVVIVAANPARQFATGRNTKRWEGVNSVLNAVHQNLVDNGGVFTCAFPIPTTTATVIKKTGGVDLCSCLVPDFVAGMPYDPNASGASYTDCSNYDTGYTIIQSTTTGRITVAAPSAELSATIEVER
ncbi:MAG: type II secretion system protein [Candidatus Paceibacterota bacterium]|jgi:prepilin-type N-terminal cleavage/methylation domain-containing protein